MLCRLPADQRLAEARDRREQNVLIRTSYLRRRDDTMHEWRGRVVTVCELYPSRGDVLILQLAGTRRECMAIPLSVILDIESWAPPE